MAAWFIGKWGIAGEVDSLSMSLVFRNQIVCLSSYSLCHGSHKDLLNLLLLLGLGLEAGSHFSLVL